MAPRGKRHRQGERPETEPTDFHDYLDPHKDLRFPRLTESRRRLWRMLDREIKGARTIDWGMLESVGDLERAERIVGQVRETPWRRMFDLGFRVAYREMTLEFLSTFRFTPPPRGDSDIDPRDHIAVRFTLCGDRFEMTLAEWAVSLGFYTQEETEADEFYTGETQSEPVPLLAWWPAIGAEIQSDVVRATTIRDPLHRYLHRCIAYSITGRDQSTEQVTLLDMFFLRQLLTPRRVNLAHCMASYFLTIHQGKMDSPIVCGAYVTVLASRLGLFTDEVVVGQTQSATPKTLGKSTVVAMGIARQIGSQFRWTFDKGVTIWHPPVQGHPPVQQPPPEGAHPPPPPPPPPPQPRTIIRQIPPTAEYMAESLHLLREMHAMHAWSMDFLYDWGVAQGMTPAERPVLVPFVPQPAMPGDAGQRVVDDAESAMGDESDHTPPF